MNLICISALKDNYIWLLYNNAKQCLIIDPGEAEPVLSVILKKKLTPIAILLTHHHKDHIDGIDQLLYNFPMLIYGPKEILNKRNIIIVNENDDLILLDRIFKIILLKGHTLGHIGFYSDPWLFSGDTIFSAGCGRIFEGTALQMYTSFQKINQLPSSTLICAAHEYTLSNLDFAKSLLPKNDIINNYWHKIKRIRIKNCSSLPTTLYLERQINLFLRCNDLELQKALNIFPSHGEEWRVFSKLRKKKDSF